MQLDEQRVPVSTNLVSIGLVLALASAALSMYFVSKFTNLFEGFGAELPALTRLVTKYYLAVWLLPLIVLAAALFDPNRAARGRRCLILGLFGGFVVFVIVLVAMYLPILNMGSVTK